MFLCGLGKEIDIRVCMVKALRSSQKYKKKYILPFGFQWSEISESTTLTNISIQKKIYKKEFFFSCVKHPYSRKKQFLFHNMQSPTFNQSPLHIPFCLPVCHYCYQQHDGCGYDSRHGGYGHDSQQDGLCASLSVESSMVFSL